MIKKASFLPNSTQTPNIVYDFLISRLPGAEARCILYICRRTYGFHKKIDRISFSQFLNGIKSRDGKTVRFRIEDILMHVVEEGIHHRGELLCIYWQHGIQPPYTSYMDYKGQV